MVRIFGIGKTGGVHPYIEDLADPEYACRCFDIPLARKEIGHSVVAVRIFGIGKTGGVHPYIEDLADPEYACRCRTMTDLV